MEHCARTHGHAVGRDLRDVLKEYGLRYSRPREVILGFLLEEDRHVSAESLYVDLKGRGEDLSLSTVYLNLSALADAGLVREFKGASGQSLYDSNVTPHYHVVCRETGEILDVPAPTVDGKPLSRFLKDQIEAATGWTVDEPRFSLSGVSPRAKAAREKRDAVLRADRTSALGDSALGDSALGDSVLGDSVLDASVLDAAARETSALETDHRSGS